MKKIVNIVLIATAFFITSCDYNGKHFPNYNDNAPTDVQTIDYTMTDADYKTVATNSTNKALANADGVADELELVETQKAFSEAISAEKYAPALLASKFLTMDNTSAVRLTYNVMGSMPAYIDTLNRVGIIALNNNDYDTVYNTASDTTYFKNQTQINTFMSKILKGRLPAATQDTIIHTTYNFRVGTTTEIRANLFKYSGSDWVEYKNSLVYVMQKNDYTPMGIRYDNFSGTQADSYLPVFLKNKYPYAAADQKVCVVYKYYVSSSNTYIKADEYTYDGTSWAKSTAITTVTSQFVKTSNKWVFNPSVTINLSPIRNDAAIKAYYQAAVDWVWENIDQPAGCTAKGQGYVTSYGNNDYYGGMSAYYNNVDMRPSKAREHVANSPIEAIKNAYPSSMTDEEVVAKMTANLIKSLNGMLEKMHPEAEPVDGIEVTYTINMPFYQGNEITKNTHTVKFKVIAAGKFEYVEGSLQPIE